MNTITNPNFYVLIYSVHLFIFQAEIFEIAVLIVNKDK